MVVKKKKNKSYPYIRILSIGYPKHTYTFYASLYTWE